MRNHLLWAAAYAGCVASIVIFATMGGAIYLKENATWTAKEMQTAAIFFVTSITAEQIQNNYRAVSESPTSAIAILPKKVRILIVPGHRPDNGGTEFNTIRERDIVVDIANALYTLLAQNPHYEVMVARTKTAWNPILQSYFDTHAIDIETLKQSLALQMQGHLAEGSILTAADQVYHDSAPSAAAFELYGINKWTSDNKYDITLHLHLNDDSEHRAGATGKYSGFAVYVPDHQYSNAEASKAVAEAIAARLSAYHATSTLPKEDKGVVEDQQLIATGSNNSVDDAALLIEYGYIYEPQFQRESVRNVAIADYAYQTYLGLQDFFNDSVTTTFGSVSFPYEWDAVNAARDESGPGIYALQAVLHRLGYYPPKGRSFSDCPVSGRAGTCTRAAIGEYQNAHGLATTGKLGPHTRAELQRELAAP